MRNIFEYADEEHLAHHGIKGQKWGVRRFQNPDGTLTDAGQKRYYGKAEKIQRDIDSFKGLEKGIYTDKGKMLLSSDDVKNSVNALKDQKDKAVAKGDKRRARDAEKLNKPTVRRFQNPDGSLTDAGKQRLKTAAKVGLAMAGAAAVVYGGYKLNNIAIDSLQKKDLLLASEWVQKQNLLTEKVDSYLHESLRLRTVIRDGENLGDIAADAARYNMTKAQSASEMYKYYADRAHRRDYDIYDRYEEIKTLLGNK